MDCHTPGFPVLHHPWVCTNSYLLSQWCHPAISSSVSHFSCPQYFPASGSFPMSWLFASGGQAVGASASASVLPMNIQGWVPLGWIGWISLVWSLSFNDMFFPPLVLSFFNKIHLTKILCLWHHSWRNTRESTGKTYSAVGSEMKGSPWQQVGWFLEQRSLSSQCFLYISHLSCLSHFFQLWANQIADTPPACTGVLSRDSLFKKPFYPCVCGFVCGWGGGLRVCVCGFACVCAHPENKVPLVLWAWCQGQFLILVYKAFLLLMQQLADY